jgi:hypothetical protein
MGEERKLYKVLVVKPEGKMPLGKPRRRWDSIRMHLGKIGWGLEWIQTAQDRDQWRALVNTDKSSGSGAGVSCSSTTDIGTYDEKNRSRLCKKNFE